MRWSSVNGLWADFLQRHILTHTVWFAEGQLRSPDRPPSPTISRNPIIGTAVSLRGMPRSDGSLRLTSALFPGPLSPVQPPIGQISNLKAPLCPFPLRHRVASGFSLFPLFMSANSGRLSRMHARWSQLNPFACAHRCLGGESLTFPGGEGPRDPFTPLYITWAIFRSSRDPLQPALP